MKKLRTFLVLALVSFTCVSCNIDFMYIGLAGTSWRIAAGNQYGYVFFSPDGKHSCVLQHDLSQSAVQVQCGTYDADGSKVYITDEFGTVNKITRTFSHLKNSKNSNFSRVSPVSYDKLDNSVWGSLQGRDLYVVHFHADGTARRFIYRNVLHREGYAFGWETDTQPYAISGGRLSLSTEGAYLYPEIFVTDASVPYARVAAVGGTASNAYAGTFWELDGQSTTGGILFFNDGRFLRFTISSEILFQAKEGSYSVGENNKLTLKLDELEETCTISDGKFSFLEKSYRKIAL